MRTRSGRFHRGVRKYSETPVSLPKTKVGRVSRQKREDRVKVRALPSFFPTLRSEIVFLEGGPNIYGK